MTKKSLALRTLPEEFLDESWGVRTRCPDEREEGTPSRWKQPVHTHCWGHVGNSQGHRESPLSGAGGSGGQRQGKSRQVQVCPCLKAMIQSKDFLPTEGFPRQPSAVMNLGLGRNGGCLCLDWRSPLPYLPRWPKAACFQGTPSPQAQVRFGWLFQHLKISCSNYFASDLQNKQRLCCASGLRW